MVRPQIECSLIVRERIFDPAPLSENVAPIRVGVGQSRFEFEGTVIACERLRVSPETLQHVARVNVGTGILRSCRGGASEQVGRFLQAPRLGGHDSKQCQGLEVIGSGLQNLTANFLRFDPAPSAAGSVRPFDGSERASRPVSTRDGTRDRPVCGLKRRSAFFHRGCQIGVKASRPVCPAIVTISGKLVHYLNQIVTRAFGLRSRPRWTGAWFSVIVSGAPLHGRRRSKRP